MPREIMNEGRVVGFSAYELYLKLHQATDPGSEPATEREWLASSLAMGTSMLLKVPVDASHKDDENWVKDFQFPSTCNICAASTIMASFFKGKGEYNGNWATRVSSYGALIDNTSASHPSGDVNNAGTIPDKSAITAWTDEEKGKLSNYMKIVDGIIIHPGKWLASTKKPPEMDFQPDLGDYPRIRILFRGPITEEFEVLLTGFSLRTVVKGETGLETSTNTQSPQNGDFLGPQQFPWANKVVFSIPSSYVAYFQTGAYTRKLPSISPDNLTVKDTSVIDMATTKPETYYEHNYQGARVQTNVSEFTTLGDGTSVLTIYQKKDTYPPALYGTFVDSKGTNYLNPIDVVAPGTIKMFEDADASQLKDYEDTFEGTFGMNKKSDDGTIGTLDENGELQPIADVSSEAINYTNPGSSPKLARVNTTKTGKKSVKSLSLSTDTPGTDLTFKKDTGDQTYSRGNTTAVVGTTGFETVNQKTDNITWPALLEALANDKVVDILGQYLKLLKVGLAFQSGGTPYPYIQFANGLRFYISNTKPPEANVPEGSIGIGWGFYEE